MPFAKQLEGKTIVVVGNGPSATVGAKGVLVDGHDLVLRLNNYQIQGYEEGLGNRTDIWARSGSPDVRDRSDYRNRVLIASPRPRMKRVRRLTQMYKDREGIEVEAVSRGEVQRLRSRMGIRGTGKAPTTGAIVVDWLLQFVDCVTILGFDHFQGKDHHYWGTAVRTSILGWGRRHSPAEESQIFTSWEREGRVVRI